MVSAMTEHRKESLAHGDPHRSYLYLCGDARHMAPAVEATLRAIAGRHGALDDDGAAEWLTGLRAGGRYHRDVY